MSEQGADAQKQQEQEVEAFIEELRGPSEEERKPLSDLEKLKLLHSAQSKASAALEDGEAGAAAKFARTETALAWFEQRHPKAVRELARQTAEAALRKREAAVRRPPQPPAGGPAK